MRTYTSAEIRDMRKAVRETLIFPFVGYSADQLDLETERKLGIAMGQELDPQVLRDRATAHRRKMASVPDPYNTHMTGASGYLSSTEEKL